MRTVNKVIIIGNVTRDPSVKQSEWKKKIALFTIATNRYFKTTTGENKSESEFHNCVAWGTLADKLETSLTKGKLVYIEWRLRTRVIEKENWEKNYKTEIVVTNLIFLNKKSDFTESSEDEILDDDLFEEDDKF